MQSGLKLQPQVFLLSDAHIFSDVQLEDVSIMLNTCDLQQIYEREDMDQILESAAAKDLCVQKGL